MRQCDCGHTRNPRLRTTPTLKSYYYECPNCGVTTKIARVFKETAVNDWEARRLEKS